MKTGIGLKVILFHHLCITAQDPLQMKTIIDLRTDLEIAAKPDPAIPGAQWVHVPLLDTWEYEEIGLRTLTESGLEEMRNQGPEMMDAGFH